VLQLICEFILHIIARGAVNEVVILNLMYLVNGTVCLSLWVIPGWVVGVRRCRGAPMPEGSGRAGWAQPVPVTPGGYRGDAARGRAGSGGTGGMSSLGPSTAARPTRLR